MANFGDTIIYGLIVTLFGMGIVFIVLILLQYILKSMELVFHRGKKTSPAVTQVKEVEAPAAPEIHTAFEEETEDDQLVAVITAAVIACLGGNHNIVVRSVRRTEDHTPAWGRISRTEQMGSRF